MGSATLFFVGVMELTIVTVSWKGLETARRLEQKLAPVIKVMEGLTPEQIEAGARRIQAWFEKSDVEKEIERRGL